MVANAISQALKAKSLKCILAHLPENDNVAERGDSSMRVRFSIVESAAKEVADAVNAQRAGAQQANCTGPIDVKFDTEALKCRAVSALEKHIEIIADQKKGPGPLSVT